MEQRVSEDRRTSPHPLEPRFDAVEKRIDRMEEKLDKIMSIETAIREMSIIATTNRKEMDKQWERIDDHNAWRQTHLAYEAAEHQRICQTITESADKFKETTDDIKSEVHAWINQDKGRNTVIVWAVGVIQVLLIGSLTWQFNQIMELGHHVTDLSARFEQHIVNKAP